MANSPQTDVDGPVRVVVLCDGQDVGNEAQLIELTVHKALNRLPAATLVFADGDISTSTFPLSDGDKLKPGAEVVVKLGYSDTEDEVFKGIVVKMSASIRGDNDSRLTVDCRDVASKLTVGRRSALFADMKDSDVITRLLGDAGVSSGTIDATTVQHGQLVQHYCSDWDFLLSRAEANGLVVTVDDGKLSAAAPACDGAAVLTVTYGESLISFEAELDARHQYADVTAHAWDPKSQAVLQQSQPPTTLAAQGDLDAKTLAKVMGLAQFELRSDTAMTADLLTCWAKAQQLKSALSRLRGRMSFVGSAKAKVDSVIELMGVSERFKGQVYVTGLTHQVSEGRWTTEVEFGSPAQWFTERPDIAAPPASGLLPGIEGLHIGVVTKLDADPDAEHRIQVTVPMVSDKPLWARLLQLHASNAFGAFFVPEVGDEVVLGYFNHDPQHPVVLGSLYSSKHAPAYALEAANNTKALVTRCKSKLEFNEEDKVITVITPGNNSIVISDKDKSITLKDQNGNTVTLSDAGIKLDSPKDIVISAKGKITLDAVGVASVTSKADVKVAGLNIECAAQVGFTGKGSATAELSASGQTTVKGALVMIN
jgi:Rhs element Vgr protein